MVVIAVMMGRGGSSLPGKNKAIVAGLPLMAWGMRIAKSSAVIDEFFFSSEDESLREIAVENGYQPIQRPEHLASDSAKGCDVLEHALREISKSRSLGDKDIIVMQHANSATYTPEEVASCVRELTVRTELDAVVPAYVVDDLHPYRQKRVRADGTVEAFFALDPSTSSNRQDLPLSVAFNHSFWVVRAAAIFQGAGEPPWPCMGSVVKPYLTQTVRSDVHNQQDLLETEKWLISNFKNRPLP